MPATATVVLLSLIGGLRSFELIWAMTGGGPGFTSDVIGSMIYKQYQAGFYGLSTAGNVILFLIVTAIVVPINSHPRADGRSRLMKRERSARLGRSASSPSSSSVVVFLVPFAFILVTAAKTAQEAANLDFSWPTTLAAVGEHQDRADRPTVRGAARLHQQHHPDRVQRRRSWWCSPR